MDGEGQEYLTAQITERPLFVDFYDFFKRMKGENESPALCDIDLMSEYRLARNIYILDIRQGTPTLWIRFVGANICDFFGFDTTGRFLESLNFEENFDKTIAGYKTIVREKAPYAFLNYISFQEPGLSAYKEERQFVMIRLAFPIIGDQGEVENVIGAMDFIDVEVAPYERFIQLPFQAITEAL